MDSQPLGGSKSARSRAVLGMRAASLFRDKAKLFHLSNAALCGRWGGHPHLALASFPPPPRTSVGHFSPLVPLLSRSSSHFENPSHFPFPLLQCISLLGRPHLAPAQPVFAPLQQDGITDSFGEGHFFIQPIVAIVHDHITNEQLHDSESARHTLNPTGARERARSQAISTIVL